MAAGHAVKYMYICVLLQLVPLQEAVAVVSSSGLLLLRVLVHYEPGGAFAHFAAVHVLEQAGAVSFVISLISVVTLVVCPLNP